MVVMGRNVLLAQRARGWQLEDIRNLATASVSRETPISKLRVSAGCIVNAISSLAV
jgi:hypothetical protein